MVLCVYCKLRALVLRPSINLKCDYIYIYTSVFALVSCTSLSPVLQHFLWFTPPEIAREINTIEDKLHRKTEISLASAMIIQNSFYMIFYWFWNQKSPPKKKKNHFNLVSNSEALNWWSFDGMVALLNHKPTENLSDVASNVGFMIVKFCL